MSQTALVLIIEDEARVRETLVAYLEDSDFQVITAENGRVGLEKFHQQQPDLILCDLNMPEMGGLEVLATIKADFPELPIIVVSGQGQLRDAVNALKLGAWDYITKPIEDMAILEHAINQSLERARLLRNNRQYHEHLEITNQQLSKSLQQLQEDETAGRRMQFRLLPANGIVYSRYEFSHQLLTSIYLSGDFVDYFAIDDDHLGFYMADVSGHGVPSALVTVLLKSYMSRYLELYQQHHSKGILDPAIILSRLNRNILHGDMDKHLTMFYGVINIPKNRLYYSNGGQFPFPILFDGNQARYVAHKSLPVGLFDFAKYRTETLELPAKFVMAIISDGVLEILPQATLEEKQAYLLSLIAEPQVSTDSLVCRLGLNQDDTLPDDITMLLLKKEG